VNDLPKGKEVLMLADFKAENNVDENGNPAGGTVNGTGLDIRWQNGPLAVDGVRKEPNGAFVETVIAAAKQRIEAYQNSKFSCRENAMAITKLDEALMWLDSRTRRRVAKGIEGTHKQDEKEGLALAR
jgi:hypothetical protein